MAINIDKMSIEIMRNLDIYLSNTQEDVAQAVEETAKETVEELNSSSPRSPGGGEYAESWAKKRDRNTRGKCQNSPVFQPI